MYTVYLVSFGRRLWESTYIWNFSCTYWKEIFQPAMELPGSVSSFLTLVHFSNIPCLKYSLYRSKTAMTQAAFEFTVYGVLCGANSPCLKWSHLEAVPLTSSRETRLFCYPPKKWKCYKKKCLYILWFDQCEL